jgi:uncharacterized membrane protein
MLRALFSNRWAIGLLGVLLVTPTFLFAQQVHSELEEQARAVVLEVLDEQEEEIIGTDAMRTIQEVRIRFTSGEREGEFDTMINEVVTLAPGDNIVVNRVVEINGVETIVYSDFERRPLLIGVAILFVVLLVVLSRWQGIRALVSLIASIGAILFVLVPALLAGYDPALTSVAVAAVILALVLFGTHGFRPSTTIAYIGVFGAVVVTGILALVSVNAMRLTGFSAEASVYLNFATNGQLDLAALLLGGIIIGMLGVLDDVSITQVSVVQELKAANPAFNFADLYKRAIKVGRDHIGSLVNTLALAYTGVSLPIILLYAQTGENYWLALNQEIIAAELVRIIVGSIGLILAAPFTTALAAWYYQDRVIDEHDIAHHHHH